ncbi:caspase-14-like isoform X2 [Lepisosteus oculatus]|uniref:caspase-14-like isoform X2 n=1 Tax=Lepisosteus oculatus TaxID=7918 RepID=UPI003716134D
MARGISQDDWCQALSSIIEELTEPQYKKMMMLLPKIPQSKKKMAREEMPEVIVSQYGLEESVVAVQEAVGKIPRNDPRMIGLLQPFTAALHGDSIGLQSSNTEGCYIDKDDVYDIDGAREAFILCQKENRRGAEVDLERTRKLLSKYGFKCTEETDLLGKEIIPELTAFRDRANRRQVRCCVVVLMAHGKEDSILGTDNQPALLKEIFALFNNKECPKLQGQPKVFIIQACRGSDVDEGVMQADDLPSDFEDDGIQKYKLPTISDTFTVYPTMPGNQALRHPERGSPLFWVMEEVFEKYAPRYHLADLFMKVNQKMVQPDYTLKSSTAKVTVNVETNFTKALFLR